jgi:2'-5' RNA ligase
MIKSPALAAVLQTFRRGLQKAEPLPIIGSAAAAISDRLLHRAFPGFSVPEVLHIVQALDGAGIPVLVGGGWGVDALDGHRTRYHHDVDLVLERFERDVDPARAVLAGMGFAAADPPNGGIWMPFTSALTRPGDLRVELLGVDYDLVAERMADNPRTRGSVRCLDAAAAREAVRGIGVLAGRSVPCLSKDAQALFHSGYVLRGKDARYVRRLAKIADPSPGGPTALLVPVTEVKGALRWAIGRRNSLPPHVTILFPAPRVEDVTDEARAAIKQACCTSSAIPYRLTTLGEFPGGTSFVAPQNPEPFVSLTEKMVEVFPDCEPYEGQFSEIVPHMTLCQGKPRVFRQLFTMLTKPSLPIEGVAQEVWLMAAGSRPGRWVLVGSFPLSGHETPSQTGSRGEGASSERLQ